MLILGLIYGGSPITFMVNGFILGVDLSALIVDRQVRTVHARMRQLLEDAMHTQQETPSFPSLEDYLKWAQRMIEEQDTDEGKPTRH